MTGRDRPPQPDVRAIRGVAPVLACTLMSSAALLAVAFLSARELGPAGRGTLVLLVALSSFTMLLCSGGVNTAARVYLVSPTEPLALGDYLGFAVALGSLEAVVAGAMGPLVLPAANVRVDEWTVLLLAVCGAGLLLSLLLGDALYAYGFNTRAAALAALGSTAQLLLVTALGVSDIRAAEAYFAAVALGGVLQAVLTYIVLRRSVPSGPVRFSLPEFRRVIRRGAPAVGLSLGQAATFRLDRYLIGVLLGPGPVGIYSVAATATEILWLGPISLAQVQFHGIASGRAGAAELARARRLWLGGTAVVALGMWLAAPHAVDLLLGERFRAAVTPLRVLLLGALAISSYHLDVISLAARGRTGAAGATALVGLALVTAADLVLIPSRGITGAAWASVVAYLGMAVLARLLLRSGLRRESGRSTAPRPLADDGQPLGAWPAARGGEV